MAQQRGHDAAGAADLEREYAAYVEEHWGPLVRAAVFLGCSPSDAEDAAQTTLVSCLRAWPRVQGADNRDAYVYRMLLNTIRDSHRRPWRRERATDELPERRSPDAVIAVDTADAVHRAMAGLSKVNRDVVVLRYFVQLSEAETAEALDIPRGTVKSRLSRALALLAADRHLIDAQHGPERPGRSAP